MRTARLALACLVVGSLLPAAAEDTAAPRVGGAPAPLAAQAAAPARELVREPFTLDHLSSDWEILLPDPDHVWPAAGRLHVEPSVATDWNAFARIPNLVRYRLPLAGASLEARARIEIAIDSPGHGAALLLYQDDAHWVELAFRGEAAEGGVERVLRMTRFRGGRAESVVRRHGPGPSHAPETLVLVLEREGDVFRGRVELPMAAPGVVRRAVVGELAVAGLGELRVVLKALREAPPPPGAASPPVTFDDVVALGRSADAGLGQAPEALRVEYATDFRDPGAFEREFSVLQPQAGSLVLENGLELVARYGIPGDRWTPIRNLVIWNQPLPSGTWDVEVEVDARFTSPHDDVGIVLYGEQGNALYVGHWALPGQPADGRRAYLRAVRGEQGETRFASGEGTRSDVEPTTLIFRVERSERGYVAWIDVGGRGWALVGESDILLTEPRVGLFARSARDLGKVPGAGVRFARLWLMREQGAP